MVKLKIGLDWDDVVAPFNSIAIRLANEDYKIEPPLVLEDINSWENTGRASCIRKYYSEQKLYDIQAESIPQENIDAVRRLNEIADVYFITAVYPEYMTHRAAVIQKVFPELGAERMIFGSAKSLVHFDVTLDDNICNVLDSKAKYPVLMRKPWNRNMTGLLSVNNLDEFVSLVEHILDVNTKPDPRMPKVIALVGPSGSSKGEIAKYLSVYGECEVVKGYSTKKNSGYKYLSPEEFHEHSFFEHTFYGGYEYGTQFEDVQSVLSRGKNAVMILDVCGAIGIKRHFPTLIVYVKRGKAALISSIVKDTTLDDEEKTLRLLSVDAEKKNENICDMVVQSTKDDTESYAAECSIMIREYLRREFGGK